MNQELLIAYDSLLKELALLLSFKIEAEGKDDINPEERYNDDSYNRIFNYRDMILPVFLHVQPNDEDFLELLYSSEIIEESLIQQINTILSFKKEQKDIVTSPFNPYEGTLKEAIAIFDQRLLYVLRVKFILKDIQEGIENYDLESYKVMQNSQSKDVLFTEIETMKFQDRYHEIMSYLSQYDVDLDEETLQDQKALSALSILLHKGEK